MQSVSHGPNKRPEAGHRLFRNGYVRRALENAPRVSPIVDKAAGTARLSAKAPLRMIPDGSSWLRMWGLPSWWASRSSCYRRAGAIREEFRRRRICSPRAYSRGSAGADAEKRKGSDERGLRQAPRCLLLVAAPTLNPTCAAMRNLALPYLFILGAGPGSGLLFNLARSACLGEEDQVVRAPLF
jgi:hypothetical protein